MMHPKKKKPVTIVPLTQNEMKQVVGSGNANIHTIPPELFEAMFIKPTAVK